MKWDKILTLLDAGTRWYDECHTWRDGSQLCDVLVFSNGPHDQLRVTIDDYDIASMPYDVEQALRAMTRGTILESL